MRPLLAALVALTVLVASVSPHAHEGRPHADERCGACVVRAADAVGEEALDLAPAEVPAGEVVLAPGLAPVTGAPQGAIPGQSPPVSA